MEKLLYEFGIYFAAFITGLFIVFVLVLGVNDIFIWLNTTYHLNLGDTLLINN